MSASHISVEITSRIVRPRSRARATQETTDAGLSVSSVSSRATSIRPRRRLGTSISSSPGAGGLAPIVASTPSQLSVIPPSPGTPETSA